MVLPIDKPVTEANLTAIDGELQALPPGKILRYAFENLENIAISFSGAEDVLLIDMAMRLKKDVRVFTLDTGRLHPETYQFLEKVRQHYGIKLEVLFPDPAQVEALVRDKGLFSFYQDGHKECCGIRKVAPLRRQLATLDAWITGQRHDQNPSTRSQIPVVQLDTAFSTPDHPLIKFNPLANWQSAQVWQYIRDYEVPYNPLHEKGYVSIGCEPCTRSVLPHQHEREGRWWWENAKEKECGLHAGNATQATVTMDAITLVKKIKEDGQLCPQSTRVLTDLEQRGLLEKVHQVIADERDRNSEGYALAAQHQVDAAPFFLVPQPDGSPKVYTTYPRFLAEVFHQEVEEAVPQ